MRFLGNILWFLLGGVLSAMGWCIAGLIWCVTIIGIPIGVQCFKLSAISLFPFGCEVDYEGGAISFIVNVLWLLISGLPLAICNFVWGCILCATVIGIPFGLQFFKIAKLALAPFGAVIRSID